MKKFIVKSALFSAMVAAYLFGVIYVLPKDYDSYNASSIDRHALLEKTPGPKLIFAGGSSLAFGLDSSVIQGKTDRTVINMGLTASLGVEFMINEIKPFLKKGDAVVFVIEYELYDVKESDGPTIISITLYNPKVIRYFSLGNCMSYLRYVPITFQRRLRSAFAGPPKEGDVYKRSYVDASGDLIGHKGVMAPVRQFVVLETFPESVSPYTEEILNDFSDYCEKKGVDLVLTFPPFPGNNFSGTTNAEQLKKGITRLHESIRADIKIKTAGDPLETVYPLEYFFDTQYHLNWKGRSVWTGHLADILAGPMNLK